MTATIDATTALERSYDSLGKVVANLEPGQLGAPTCCPEWDVHGLLNHILGGANMYTLVNAGHAAGEDAGDVIGDDPIHALAVTSAANLASWRQPGALEGDRTYPWGTFPAGAGLVINVGEVALHSWDLARATGQSADIDPDVAQVIYDFYRRVPMERMRSTGVYGPEISVAETAPIQQRLLGFLGRL
jgi:uncharacterized protein (TIGR03086 family)